MILSQAESHLCQQSSVDFNLESSLQVSCVLLIQVIILTQYINSKDCSGFLKTFQLSVEQLLKGVESMQFSLFTLMNLSVFIICSLICKVQCNCVLATNQSSTQEKNNIKVTYVIIKILNNIVSNYYQRAKQIPVNYFLNAHALLQNLFFWLFLCL